MMQSGTAHSPCDEVAHVLQKQIGPTRCLRTLPALATQRCFRSDRMVALPFACPRSIVMFNLAGTPP